ncbi:hypothetical protein [Streptomyces prasinus]|uniref:hypothetical protein n=1 Tax=Streptomyces prasinus TaxID=67345 RepID=UPI0033BEE722
MAATKAQKGQLEALKQQAAQEAQVRKAEKQEAAAREALRQLHLIQQQLRKRPHNEGEMGEWERMLGQLTVQIETALPLLLDKELRERIGSVVEAMSYTHELIEPGRGGSWRLPERVCAHGLLCLGAAVRHEPIPAKDQYVGRAEVIVENYKQELEDELLEWEAREE